jgi:hypothetical protein
MIDDLEATGVDTEDVGQDIDSSQGQPDVDRGQETQEAPKQDFKEIMQGEMAKRGLDQGLPGQQGVKSPFDGMEDYFAKDEIAALKNASPEVQMAMTGVLNRIAKVSQDRIDELSVFAEETQKYDKLIAGSEQGLIDAGFTTPQEYMGYLVDFDKELSNTPDEAIATLIYAVAGGSEDSLSTFMGMLGRSLGSMRDRTLVAVNDPGFNKVVEELKAARVYKQEYEKNYAVDIKQYEYQRDQSFKEAIELFRASTDRSGRLMYPHFDKVRGRMSELSSSTGIDDLEELYYMAVGADPDLRRNNGRPVVKSGLAMTNSPAGTSKSKPGLPSFRDCWNSTLSERGIESGY